MDKFTVALAALIILIMAITCAFLLSRPTPIVPQDNGNQTATAIRIALADPGVAEAINYSFGKTCRVDNVSAYGADGRSGIASSNQTLLKVALTFGTEWSVGENQGYVIDVANGTIVGREQYFRRLGMPPYSESFVVPPSACWYHLLQGVKDVKNITFDMGPTITFMPADAKLYATVVDDDNLSRFLAGEAYAPLQFMDMDTNRQGTCENCWIPSPWVINISVPWAGGMDAPLYPGPSHSYYVILKNGDPVRPVEITYDIERILIFF